MPADSRPRRLPSAALTAALALLSGCVQNPNSIFHSRTEFNRDVGGLFELLIWLGTAVFVFTEVLLVYTLFPQDLPGGGGGGDGEQLCVFKTNFNGPPASSFCNAASIFSASGAN